ncbi:MAG: YdcF family protein [Mariniphaga sp.]
MKEVLIVLGSPNSAEGKLGDIAVDRLNYCLQIFDPEKNLILCTGGFGDHFNPTNIPHANYAIDYLMNRGIDKGYFMEIALSSNSVEDAVKAKQVLVNSYSNYSLKIITSDFHLERVKLIFDHILTGFPKEYHGVTHQKPMEEKERLIQHEKKAIDEIRKNGIYF